MENDLVNNANPRFGLAASISSTIAAFLAIRLINSATERQDTNRGALAANLEANEQR